MKKLLFLILLGFLTPLFAANTDIYNITVTRDEGFTYVHYSATFTFTTGTDQLHTQAIKIGDCNNVDGYIKVVAAENTTENTDFKYKFSSDLTNWTEVVPHNLNAVGTTAVWDTIGTESTVNTTQFDGSIWLIIEGDGQTGQTDATVYTLDIFFTKDATLTVNGDWLRMGGVAKAITNP